MRLVLGAMLALVALVALGGPARAVDLCETHADREGACLVDGDTGWERGQKWRLSAIDAPELYHPECPAELAKAFEALDRLGELMSGDYTIRRSGRFDIYGRALVTITLRDGRDAGTVLLTEKLAQPWPNRGNRWCGR